MNTDKNTILGLLLVGLIILFTYSDFYKEWVFGENYEQVSRQTEQFVSEPPVTDGNQENTSKENIPETVPAPLTTQRTPTRIIAQNDSIAEKIITVENELFVAQISNKGPGIKSWILKDYTGYDGSPIELIHGLDGNLSFKFPFKGDTLNLNNYNLKYLGNQNSFTLDEQNQNARLPFRFYFNDNSYLDVVIDFKFDAYDFNYSIKLHNTEHLFDGYKYSISWQGGIASTEKSIQEDMEYTKAWALTADTAEEFTVDDDETLSDVKDDWIIRWGAVRNKYFSSVIIPKNQGSGIKVTGNARQITQATYFKEFEFEIYMPLKQGNFSENFLVYLGPLEYSTMKAYDYELDQMMNFGWGFIRPISKGVLWTLKKLHAVIPNYGLVIIVFSILIKILLFPLTKKSYQSMKEMQVLQPQMAELREKLKDNPQKLNSEMMALYKEHGVNPLGGCIPMLLQMPVLFALFVVFRTTIELRGAYFFGWITDLSAPDTVFTMPFTLPFYGDGINILPLLMGITMFFQQKATIQDPKQKFMIYFMPVMFTFMFNNFPSGLTLYYTLFNTFSMIQQKFIPVHPPKPKENTGKNTKPANKKPRGRLDFYKKQAELRRNK